MGSAQEQEITRSDAASVLVSITHSRRRLAGQVAIEGPWPHGVGRPRDYLVESPLRATSLSFLICRFSLSDLPDFLDATLRGDLSVMSAPFPGVSLLVSAGDVVLPSGVVGARRGDPVL